MMDVIYGIQISDMNNVHVKEAVLWGLGINETLEPGRFLVDFLPIRMSSQLPSDSPSDDVLFLVRYIPGWFPGASFQRLLARWRANMFNSRDGPFYEAKSAYHVGPILSSILAITDQMWRSPMSLLDHLWFLPY